MVKYEVTGMSVKDLYRRVKNGQINIESRYFRGVSEGDLELLLRGVLSGIPFPTIVLINENKGYRVILGGAILLALKSLLESSVYAGLDDADKFILMRHCFYVNVITGMDSVATIKEVFDKFK